MAGYPYVSRVQDPFAQQALKAAFDEIALLKSQIAALQAAALSIPTLTANGVNLQGVRLTNVGQPTTDSDALTLGLARQLIQAEVEGFGI